ncbi:MAG: hypothetical protein K1X94_31845 [Sandaracinaceae bacterium]|nr:hypothetical protein [Sandaracinaceae bacterium]
MQRVLPGSTGDVIVFDDTHFPVIIATWFGRASEASVRAYYAALGEQLARALADRLVLVNVVDTGPAEVPPADVRRLIDELNAEWERKGATDETVRAIVVIESSAIRGVLQVLGWLHARGLRTVNVSDVATAMRTANDTLLGLGHAPPLGLSRVHRPVRPQAP